MTRTPDTDDDLPRVDYTAGDPDWQAKVWARIDREGIEPREPSWLPWLIPPGAIVLGVLIAVIWGLL